MKAGSTGALYLLNCRECDSFVSISEQHYGKCLCGKSGAVETSRGIDYIGGPIRIWALSWESYDGAQVGNERRVLVVCEAPWSSYEKRIEIR